MTNTKTSAITHDVVNNGYTYEEYRTMIDELLEQDKTTGENHSEDMIHYTKMNVHRMKRHDKRSELNSELKESVRELETPWIWLVLTEAWCGDAAQIVPIFNKITEQSDQITLRFILRDKHLKIMDQFLQNGKSRSIPKLICLDAETLDVLGDWGPRPADAQELYDSLRNEPDTPYQEVAEKLHKWYADNKSQSVQKELLESIETWKQRG